MKKFAAITLPIWLPILIVLFVLWFFVSFITLFPILMINAMYNLWNDGLFFENTKFGKFLFKTNFMIAIESKGGL